MKKQAQEKTARKTMTEFTSQMQTLAYQRQQMREQLHYSIDALPESDQTLIHLHYFDGLTCKEISNVLGTSKAAVKMRLTRARAKLRSNQSVDGEATSISPNLSQPLSSAEDVGALLADDGLTLSVTGEEMWAMLEDDSGESHPPISMQFTLQIMKQVTMNKSLVFLDARLNSRVLAESEASKVQSIS